MSYVTIPTNTPLALVYPTDTDAEKLAASQALVDAGVISVPVLEGTPSEPEVFSSNKLLFAACPYCAHLARSTQERTLESVLAAWLDTQRRFTFCLEHGTLVPSTEHYSKHWRYIDLVVISGNEPGVECRTGWGTTKLFSLDGDAYAGGLPRTYPERVPAWSLDAMARHWKAAPK